MTGAIFIDLKKAFDLVDHDLLLLKLKCYNLDDNLIKLIENYISNRFLCIKLNSHFSSLKSIRVGVPQGSVLGPLLFLIFINDFLFLKTKSNKDLFADDTTLSFASAKGEFVNDVNHDLKIISNWIHSNRLVINWSKTNVMVLANSSSKMDVENIRISFGSIEIPVVNNVKLLGVVLDSKLNFSKHIETICFRINIKTRLLNRSKYLFPLHFRTILFKLFILPIIDYCSSIFIVSNIKSIDKAFKKSLLILTNINLFNIDVESQIILLKKYNLVLIHYRLFYHFCTFTINLLKYNKGEALISKFNTNNTQSHNLRNRFCLPNFHSNIKKFSYITIATKLLNAFINIKIINSNFSFVYLQKNLITLFDKHFHYFYDYNPLL